MMIEWVLFVVGSNDNAFFFALVMIMFFYSRLPIDSVLYSRTYRLSLLSIVTDQLLLPFDSCRSA